MMRILEHAFSIKKDDAIKAFIIAYLEIKDFWTVLNLPCRTFDNDVRTIIMESAEIYINMTRLEPKLEKYMEARLKHLSTSLEHYRRFV